MKQRSRIKIKGSILFVNLILLAAPSSARQSKEVNWDAFRFLLGEWVGEGTGRPGEATGGFSFSIDLQGNILVRRSYANYPAAKDKPAYSHTDLMVIHQELETKATRAVYFDNEGHVTTTGSAFAAFPPQPR